MTRSRLSLAEMERHDPHAPPARPDGERDFLCPLPGCEGKSPTRAHRSLSVNEKSGAWRCARCGEKGKLADVGEQRAPSPRRDRERARLRRTLAVNIPPPRGRQAPQPSPTGEPAGDDWLSHLKGLVPIEGTAGADYLERKRRIPATVATAATVRFASDFMGRAGIVYPLRTRAGKLVAAEARHLDDRAPKTRCVGKKSHGVFTTGSEVWTAGTVAITEGPADALTLAACGIPAIATLGTDLPGWLAFEFVSREVLIASDNDPAGEEAARQWLSVLSANGARPKRLQPPTKDWNQALQEHGVEALRAELARVLGALPDAPQSRSWAPAVTERPTTLPATETAALPDEAPPLPTDEDVPPVEDGEAPPVETDSCPAGELTIREFARSGRVVRLESPEFGKVALVADGEEAPAGFVGYTAAEMARLFAMAPEMLRIAHAVKAEFGGRLLGDDELLPGPNVETF